MSAFRPFVLADNLLNTNDKVVYNYVDQKKYQWNKKVKIKKKKL